MAQMWSSSKVMIRDLFCTVYVSGLARSLMLGPSPIAAQMNKVEQKRWRTRWMNDATTKHGRDGMAHGTT